MNLVHAYTFFLASIYDETFYEKNERLKVVIYPHKKAQSYVDFWLGAKTALKKKPLRIQFERSLMKIR